jgi:parvulin-like peptidyl-prolyl isomerase
MQTGLMFSLMCSSKLDLSKTLRPFRSGGFFLSVSYLNTSEPNQNYDILSMFFSILSALKKTDTMKYKLLTLFLLLVPCLVGAESEVFQLNGKTVPATVAKVNGVALSSTQLEGELIAFRMRAQHQGKEIKPSVELLIARELLKAEIMKEIISQKAKSLNIKIAPDQIDLQVQGVEDKFPSHTAFITALAFQHMNIKALRGKIESTLLEDELIRHEIAPNVKLSDDAVKSFYNANKAQFMKPALYRIRHILIATIPSPQKSADEASHKKALRMARMINEESKTKAEEVLQKVKAGEDNFEQLAKEFSEDEASKQKGGLLGDLHPGSTIPEIAEAMVKLNEGETSGIIDSSFGHHIVKLDEIIPSVLIPFKDAQSDILNILMKREIKKLFKEYVIELEKTAKIEIFI